MGLVSSLWQGVVEPGAVRTTSVFIHMGPRQERIKTQFENFESRPGALWWFGSCRVNLKTAVCHYFHYTFSRVPTWLVNSEQIFLCWGMGAEAQRDRI